MAVPLGVLCHNQVGQLEYVLWMLACAIRCGDAYSPIRFGVHVRNEHREGTPPAVGLKAVCGPGKQGEPVIPVMLSEEA